MTLLQIAREEAKLSSVGLARKAKVNASLVSQIERGFRKPYPRFRQAVSKALHIDEQLLFTAIGDCRTVGLNDVLEVVSNAS